jgi:LacI family transcriptional regulator
MLRQVVVRHVSVVTSRDVALAAGVAQSTVSRALNEHPSVRPDTRARVREAAERLGYIPNAAARSLIKSRTNLVGLLVSNITDAYVPELIDAVTATAFQRGYTIIIGSVQERPDLQLAYLRMLAEHQVAGAILTSGLLGSADAIRPFIQRGLPIVLANREIEGIDTDSVVFDNVAAARSASVHLRSHGRERIAFVGGRPDAATTRDRVAGYRAALDEPDGTSGRVHLGSYSRDFGYEATRALLAGDDPPDGLVAADDTVAIGCLDAIADAGLAVGIDIAVIGFGDQPAASMRSVSLSTVGASARALGRAAFELLVDRLEGKIDGPRRRIVLGHELVLRTSCGGHHPDVD